MIKLTLVENDIKPVKTAMEAELTKAIKHLESELIKIRTGRAHTSLVEDLLVVCYGGTTTSPLNQLASLAAPDPLLITIQPWDLGTINEIEKAILNSSLGLNPINDGKIIKLPLPRMSSARRDDLIKILGKKLEECKISIRNVRREFNDLIKDGKKNKAVSENFYNRLCDVTQEVTDKFIEQATTLAGKKEQELSTV